MDIIDYSDGKQSLRKRQTLLVRERSLLVALYIHDLSPGGVERQNLVLARELQERGVNVVLVVHQLRGELIPLLPSGVPVVNLRGQRTLHDVVRLRRFMIEEKPDILMANVDHNNVAAALAKALTASPTKLVICQHNPISAGFHATVNWKHRLIPWFYRLLASRIDHAIAVSNGIAEELTGQAGLPPAKVSAILNAVIGRDFEDRAAEPVTHPWLIAKDRPVFVSAARLVEMKDPRNLLRAFAKHVRQQAARLLLLGVGPLLPELRDMAASLGIADHVGFAGFVANPLPYMRAADAFVLSSRSEGFGNVLVEALGCGTPVISTDCPHGPADILDHGKYGVLVPPRDPDALARAMGDILDRRAQWPIAKLQRRAAEFSYANCADSYLKLFERLVKPAMSSAIPNHASPLFVR